MVKIDNVTLAMIVGGVIVVGLVIWWVFFREPSPKQDLADARRPPAVQQQASQPAPPQAAQSQRPQSQRGSPSLVLFYGDHCPHCHSMMPAWQQVRQAVGDKLDVKQIESQNPEMSSYVPPRGVPTIRLYRNGVTDPENFEEYSGDRSAQSILDFVMNSEYPKHPKQQ